MFLSYELLASEKQNILTEFLKMLPRLGLMRMIATCGSIGALIFKYTRLISEKLANGCDRSEDQTTAKSPRRYHSYEQTAFHHYVHFTAMPIYEKFLKISRTCRLPRREMTNDITSAYGAVYRITASMLYLWRRRRGFYDTLSASQGKAYERFRCPSQPA